VFYFSGKAMARCNPLNEVVATNVAEVENLGGVEVTAEVAHTVGGDIPAISNEEGRVSSVGRTDDSMDEGASNNENSQTYNFGASTITLGRIKEMVEKGYFVDGEAWAPGAEAVPELENNEAVIYEDFLLLVYACLRILPWLIFC
jgi:hypothetical protein